MSVINNNYLKIINDHINENSGLASKSPED